MYKFKTKLLYNEEIFFGTKTELLDFKFTLPLAKLDMVGSRLVSNRLIFSDDVSVNIQYEVDKLVYQLQILSLLN